MFLWFSSAQCVSFCTEGMLVSFYNEISYTLQLLAVSRIYKCLNFATVLPNITLK
jgi:hypothetical protein